MPTDPNDLDTPGVDVEAVTWAGYGWLGVFGVVGGFLATFAMGTFVYAVAAAGLDSASSAPSGGGDAVALLTGERIYATQCVRCHGAEGEGGIGVRIGGGAVQLRIIAEGRGTMPAFATTLTAEEIRAVPDYERELLGR